MEHLWLIAIGIDSALCCLIWLVQRIIYPSFQHIDQAQLKAWHQDYTGRIATVVVPLMLAQVVVVGTRCVLVGTLLTWLVALLTAVCWACTFFLSVPIHAQLTEGAHDRELLQRLVRTNWPRTLAWSFIVACTLLDARLFPSH